MKRILLSALWLLSVGCSVPPQPSGPIAITHAVILDGNGGPPVEDGTELPVFGAIYADIGDLILILLR